jgi:hypothetical protein
VSGSNQVSSEQKHPADFNFNQFELINRLASVPSRVLYYSNHANDRHDLSSVKTRQDRRLGLNKNPPRKIRW